MKEDMRKEQDEIKTLKEQRKKISNRIRRLVYKSSPDYRNRAIKRATDYYKRNKGVVTLTNEDIDKCEKIIKQTKKEIQ